MTDLQKEYIEYLTRCSRNTSETVLDWHNKAISKEVGESYGLSVDEMGEAVENGQEV